MKASEVTIGMEIEIGNRCGNVRWIYENERILSSGDKVQVYIFDLGWTKVAADDSDVIRVVRPGKG